MSIAMALFISGTKSPQTLPLYIPHHSAMLVCE